MHSAKSRAVLWSVTLACFHGRLTWMNMKTFAVLCRTYS
jgi:hypothetical protein